jgi:hypothetical protein
MLATAFPGELTATVVDVRLFPSGETAVRVVDVMTPFSLADVSDLQRDHATAASRPVAAQVNNGKSTSRHLHGRCSRRPAARRMHTRTVQSSAWAR